MASLMVSETDYPKVECSAAPPAPSSAESSGTWWVGLLDHLKAEATVPGSGRKLDLGSEPV
eukprot:scaffold1596_cov302-Pinguiococcus_pyrenoidosus.AAC.24